MYAACNPAPLGNWPQVGLWSRLCSKEPSQSAHQRGARHSAQELRKERPSLKLLYITPEQLVASAALTDALQQLKQRGLLARFVVDEVRLLPSPSTSDACGTPEILTTPVPASRALQEMMSTITVISCIEIGHLRSTLSQSLAISAGTLREPMGP